MDTVGVFASPEFASVHQITIFILLTGAVCPMSELLRSFSCVLLSLGNRGNIDSKNPEPVNVLLEPVNGPVEPVPK